MTGRLSLREFRAIRDDQHCHELNQGELVVTPIPFARHTIIVTNIHDLLPSREQSGGYFFPRAGYLLSRDPRATVRAPDLSFLSRARVVQTPGDQYVEGAPELAIGGEVLRLEDSDTITTGLFHGWSARVADFFDLDY